MRPAHMYAHHRSNDEHTLLWLGLQVQSYVPRHAAFALLPGQCYFSQYCIHPDCCSVIDGKHQLKHAPAAKKVINKIKKTLKL